MNYSLKFSRKFISIDAVNSSSLGTTGRLLSKICSVCPSEVSFLTILYEPLMLSLSAAIVALFTVVLVEVKQLESGNVLVGFLFWLDMERRIGLDDNFERMDKT